MEAEGIERIIRSYLRGFVLYREDHVINITKLPELQIGARRWAISYRTDDRVPRGDGTTHFDAEIHGDRFYLLFIEIERSLRGLGHGSQLYQILEQAAKALGCKTVWQTPSGKTWRGDGREDYLQRRGYRFDGGEMRKDL